MRDGTSSARADSDRRLQDRMDHVDDAGLPNTARSSVDLAIVGVIAGHMELHLKVPRGRHDPGVPEPSVRRCAMGTSYVLPVHHIARQNEYFRWVEEITPDGNQDG